MADPGANLFDRTHGGGGGVPAVPSLGPVGPPTSPGAHLFDATRPGARVRPASAVAKSSGGGSFFGNLIGDPIHAAVGLGPALFHTGVGVYKDVTGLLPSVQLSPHGVSFERPQLPKHTYNRVVEPMGQDPFVQDIWAGIRHPLRSSSIYAYVTGGKQPKSAVVSDIKQGHLFVPVLDALALTTFGGARIAALAAVPERAAGVTANEAIGRALVRGQHLKANPGTITVKDTATGAPIVVRTLPRNMWQAGRMQAVDRTLKYLTGEAERLAGRSEGSFPVVGQSARVGRALGRVEQETKLGLMSDPRLFAYQRAFARLSREDRVALNLIGKVPLPNDLAAWKALLADQGGAQALLEHLNNSEVLKTYTDGLGPQAKTKFVRAHEAAVNLAHAREDILTRGGALDAEAAAESIYDPTRVARGAEYVEPTPARLGVPSPALVQARGNVARLERLHETAVRQASRNAAATIAGLPGRAKVAEKEAALAALPEGTVPGVMGGRIVHEGRFVLAHGSARAERLGAALSVARDKLTQLEEAAQRRVRPTGIVGGGTPEEIANEILAADRPQPFYTPDVMATDKKTRAQFSRSGGRTVPTPDVKASKRILFRMGQVALHPDLLTPSYLRAAAYEAKLAKHAAVKEIATPIAKDAPLPPDMEWVRELKGQSIPHTMTMGGEHAAEMEKIFPEDRPLTVKEGEGEIAMDAEGRRLAVSRTLARKLAVEVKKEGLVTKWLWQKPTDVWRALVLNLRIPWLINNIVGNQLLYALRFAGIDGLKAYVGMLSEPLRTRVFRLASSGKHLSREDMAAVFPGQARGTLIETSLPTGVLGTGKLATGRLGKAIRGTGRVLGAGLAPLDRRSEAALRRAAVETVLRGSPEVKALYRSMPKETRTLRAAMVRAAEDNPELRRLANTEANRALGDYLSLTPFEQGALRRVVPFYGWYREIARIAGHAVVDTPVRVALLSNLAILEEQRQQDIRGGFPSFLEGSYALGPGKGGTENILSLRGVNPASTIADEIRIGQFVTGSGGGRAGADAALGVLSPFMIGPVEYGIAKAKGGPTDFGYTGGVGATLGRYAGPFGAAAATAFGGLPQVQAISPPPPSRLSPNRDRNTILLSLLENYYRSVGLRQAHLYGTQGR